MRREVEADVPWHAPSGAVYRIPTRLVIVAEQNYGADYDGNRGIATWDFEDFEVMLPAEEYSTVITNPDDLECFDPDLLSEDAFEAAMDKLYD